MKIFTLSAAVLLLMAGDAFSQNIRVFGRNNNVAINNGGGFGGASFAGRSFNQGHSLSGSNFAVGRSFNYGYGQANFFQARQFYYAPPIQAQAFFYQPPVQQAFYYPEPAQVQYVPVQYAPAPAFAVMSYGAYCR